MLRQWNAEIMGPHQVVLGAGEAQIVKLVCTGSSLSDNLTTRPCGSIPGGTELPRHLSWRTANRGAMASLTHVMGARGNVERLTQGAMFGMDGVWVAKRERFSCSESPASRHFR